MSQVHVEILQNARERIRNDTDEFVCWAVDYTEIVRFEAKQILEWIKNALENKITLDRWLESKGYDIRIPNRDNFLKGTRLRWIDWMIENNKMFEDVTVDE